LKSINFFSPLQKLFGTIFLLIVGLASNAAYSQNLSLPIYSDYLTDNYYLVHPSMAGASNFNKIRLTGRQQWFDVNEAPSL
jgi:hypothetical protein